MSEIKDEDLLQFFKKYDTDGSGQISAKELEGLLKDIGMELDPKTLEDFLKEIDEDGNAEVGFEEFKKLVMGD